MELLDQGRLKQAEVGYFAQNLRYYGEVWRMAKNGRSSQRNVSSGNTEFTWVTIELTDTDYDTIDAIDWTAADVLSSLTEIVRDGYSVATKLDVRTGSIACHITCNQDGHRDNRHGVTGYADDLQTACVVALFKLDNKAEGSLSAFRATKRKYR